MTKPWTMKPCFSGPDCWCRIIVDPDGNECNYYGDLCRENCRYIIDALNRKSGAETNVNERHPVPWHVETLKSGCKCIVTTAGLGKDDLETCVSTAKGIFPEYIDLFVEAVNGFYGGGEE